MVGFEVWGRHSGGGLGPAGPPVSAKQGSWGARRKFKSWWIQVSKAGLGVKGETPDRREPQRGDPKIHTKLTPTPKPGMCRRQSR